MGEEFIQFKCHHCNHCCTDVVCLPTPWDVRRIAKMTDKDVFDFVEFLSPDEVEDVDADDPTWLKVGDERFIMALKRDETTGCTFLNNETKFCSIYEARPLLCRLYPFKVVETKDEKFKGFVLQDGVGCPKNLDGKMEVKPLYDLYIQDDLNQEDYFELVEVFNAKEYEGKDALDFVIMFTGGLLDFESNVAESNS